MAKDDSKVALDGKHLVAVGALGAAVLLVLVLGAWLQTDSSSTEPVARAESPLRVPSPALKVFQEPVADAQPAEAPPLDRDSLQGRSRRDRQRLDAAAERWLLQLAVMCDPDNVRRVLAEHGGNRSLLVLPAQIADRDCHRICYGPYGSRAQALSDRGLPAGLRALGEPQVRSTAEMLP